MQVDDAPTDDYTDIGGLDKQIQELIEAVVLPMTHAERFTSIGTIVGAAVVIIIIMMMVMVMVVMMIMMMMVVLMMSDDGADDDK